MQLVNELIKGLLPEEETKKTIGVFAGGFKPPTKGHFEVLKRALDENPEIDEMLVFVGKKERDGITQDESLKVWEIYGKYLPFKVKFVKATTSPIRLIYNTAKDNPEDEVVWVIGAREGNEEDFKDLASRTKGMSKYPNLELRTVITTGGTSTTSGTAARNALQVSKEKFDRFIPDFLSDQEKQDIYVMLTNRIQEKKDPKTGLDYITKKKEASKKKTQRLKNQKNENVAPNHDGKAAPFGSGYKKVNENASYTQNINVKREIADLTKHMLKIGLNIRPLPKLIFKHGDSKNAREFLGKTAYYDPNTQTIVLYTEGRHPKDIVRSYSHEMVHHIQNLENRLGDIQGTNTMEDDHLNQIEQEANLMGTMTFRNWTDSLNENKKKDPFGINAYAMELARLREEETEYQIYCDMDGVLADFERGYEELTGINLKNDPNPEGKEFWDPISKAGVKFWAGLKWMPDGQELWDYIKPHTPKLLSAPSREESSRIGKYVWVKNKIPGTKLILRYADRKKELASPTSILIDDRKANIDSWEAAGGIGILHTSTTSTIEKLKELGL